MTIPNILCRELSLLAFNRRVLAQVSDERVPLLERLRFLCIVASNLDEFFEVRMARLKREEKRFPNLIYDSGKTPTQTIESVTEETHKIIKEQYQMFNELVLPSLACENVLFYRRKQWTAAQREWIENYFNRELLPILTPISLDAAHPFPRLLNKSLNFVVELYGDDSFNRPAKMAIVQAPRLLPRVVKLPSHLCNGADGFVFLSSILHEYVYKLFRGMEIKSCNQFRLTRDSSLLVDEEDMNNLRTALKSELKDRDFGDAVRLEVSDQCPEHICQFLLNEFRLQPSELYQVQGPVNLVRLMAVPDMVARQDLKFVPYTPSYPDHLKKNRMIDEIARSDILLHHPYQSFEPVVKFIQEAAHDKDVVAIKMTIYRTGQNSALAKALEQAALAGKQVTVVVELMARFDEANNINWAGKLEEAGAHVVYGVLNYKIHAKMALVIRRESGILKKYAHLGTGNYHQGTSRIYTDFGLFTADTDITRDVNDLFMIITGAGKQNPHKKLFSSPNFMHKMVINKIEREIENATAGKPARIMAKMNSLIEPKVIEALYAASKAGVKIDLIVRGMCALRPQTPDFSENIRVFSIIGRLLEHSRVYYFENDGTQDVLISSADWMGRNFFNRVEVATPILSPKLKQRVIEESFTLALSDNLNAWEMHSDGSYTRVTPQSNDEVISLQQILLAKYSV